uniref:Uncharacterized protein n=1 Tax=Romanomermis culicivorax TaxID=13658 RepID=A0A915KG42_ROMCU
MKQPIVEQNDAEGGDQQQKKVGLERHLGLFSGVNIIVGCIIGSGIFVSPKGIHEKAGSVGLSLVIWVVCGLFSAVGAYCYAELGTMIKRSGGDYAYISDAFGPFLGFMRLWVEAIVVRPCTMTIVALTFAVYMLTPFFPDCDLPACSTEILAAVLINNALQNYLQFNDAVITFRTFVFIITTALYKQSSLLRNMPVLLDYKIKRDNRNRGFENLKTVTETLSDVRLILTFVNCYSVKLATKVQDIFTVAKVLALILVVLTGRTENFENIFEGTSTDPAKISLGFYAGLFAYQGW